MQVVRDGDEVGDDRPSAISIGVFDGLHRGHQALLAAVVARAGAEALVATVVTFDPPPAAVLAPDRGPRRIQRIDQRLEGLMYLGVERVRLITFSEGLRHESASAFVERVLVHQLHARDVVVGEDFRFGRDREGDVELLEGLGARWGFEVRAVSIVRDGARLSSTAVREFLERGNVEGARRVLGRPFTLRGEVAPGDARGRALGFATANLTFDDLQQLPSDGVYAALARVAPGEWRAAAVSIGTRPQYYVDGARLFEVHVLDFSGDLYGATLDVALLARLRDQEVFSGEQGLVERIAQDVARTRDVAAAATADQAELLRWDVGQRR